jgi:nicotinamidase/pyrazinamidase
MTPVFFDIDTQYDFLLPAGALYVPGAERIIPTIAALNRYASQKGIPLVSTADAHSEQDPEFAQWPAHCVAGTLGQKKPPETMVGQIVLEKQALDIFTNPELRPLLQRLNGSGYIVYGVATEYCVRLAALGLLETGKPVTLVTDAIQAISPEGAERTLREFAARGGRLVTSDQVRGA